MQHVYRIFSLHISKTLIFFHTLLYLSQEKIEDPHPRNFHVEPRPTFDPFTAEYVKFAGLTGHVR